MFGILILEIRANKNLIPVVKLAKLSVPPIHHQPVSLRTFSEISTNDFFLKLSKHSLPKFNGDLIKTIILATIFLHC